jgi:uncharacterized protein with PIN domain
MQSRCKKCRGPIVRSRRFMVERMLGRVIDFRAFRCVWCHARTWRMTLDHWREWATTPQE